MSQRPSEIKKRGKISERRVTQPHSPLGRGGSEHFIRRGCWNKPQEELGQGRAGKNSHAWSASAHLDDHFISTLYKPKIIPFAGEKTEPQVQIYPPTVWAQFFPTLYGLQDDLRNHLSWEDASINWSNFTGVEFGFTELCAAHFISVLSIAINYSSIRLLTGAFKTKHLVEMIHNIVEGLTFMHSCFITFLLVPNFFSIIFINSI